MGVKRLYLNENVLDAALDRVRWVFREFQTVYVSFSGGKDSTVVLNLALQVAEEMGRLPVPVMFIDQEAEWQSVIDYIRTVMNDQRVSPRWLQVPIKLFNATSTTDPWLNCWDPAKESEWIRPKEAKSLHRNVYGTDRFKDLFTQYLLYHHRTKPVASLTGMRCEESPGRTLGLTAAETYKGVTWGAVSGAGDQFYRRKHFVFCNTGEAPVWMGDYSFKRIDQVAVGDEVIGFTAPGVGNGARARKGKKPSCRSSLVRTRVVAVASQILPVVKITLASGRTIRCTPQHRWQRKAKAGGATWYFGSAKVGDRLAFVVDPVPQMPVTADGGWLGGLYDGEGSGDVIVQSESVNHAICARLRTTLERLGFDYQVGEKTGGGASQFRIRGGRRELVRFFNLTRPTKRADGYVLGGRFRSEDVVVSIVPDGCGPVYSLQTEVGTYVVWGFASSNSPIYDWSYTDVWKAIHDHGWPYTKLYDSMYQYGVPVLNMRVSNVHHETATRSLWYLQEIEAETWEKVTKRLSGINSAGHLQASFFQPKTLPPMFKDWVEYRDYLLTNLITDPTTHATFLKQFASFDRQYGADAKLFAGLVQAEINAILLNDYHGTIIGNFTSAHVPPERLAKRAAKAALEASA